MICEKNIKNVWYNVLVITIAASVAFGIGLNNIWFTLFFAPLFIAIHLLDGEKKYLLILATFWTLINVFLFQGFFLALNLPYPSEVYQGLSSTLSFLLVLIYVFFYIKEKRQKK